MLIFYQFMVFNVENRKPCCLKVESGFEYDIRMLITNLKHKLNLDLDGYDKNIYEMEHFNAELELTYLCLIK